MFLVTKTVLLRTLSDTGTLSVVLCKIFKRSPKGTKKKDFKNKSIDLHYWKKEEKTRVFR